MASLSVEVLRIPPPIAEVRRAAFLIGTAFKDVIDDDDDDDDDDER